MKFRTASKRLPMLVAAVAAMACSANVAPSGEGDADTHAPVHALLTVRQNTPQGGTTARSEASLWFIHLSDSSGLASAVNLLTDEVQLPTMGACRVLPSEPSARTVRPPESPVELSYVGDVAMKVSGRNVALSVRAFPDVANLVSGVVYTLRNRGDLPWPLERPMKISVESFGGSSSPVVLQTTPPPAFTKLLVSGQIVDETEVSVDRREDLELTWKAPSSDAVVYADVAYGTGDATRKVRCAWEDHGAGRIPRELLPQDVDRVELTVHRLATVDMVAREDGIVGQARFDLSRSVDVHLTDGP